MTCKTLQDLQDLVKLVKIQTTKHVQTRLRDMATAAANLVFDVEFYSRLSRYFSINILAGAGAPALQDL